MQSSNCCRNCLWSSEGKMACLLKRNDMNIDNIPHVITAACVLHNICEVHHEHFNDAWLQIGEGEYTQPAAVASRDTPTGIPQDIRNALVQYFQNN